MTVVYFILYSTTSFTPIDYEATLSPVTYAVVTKSPGPTRWVKDSTSSSVSVRVLSSTV